MICDCSVEISTIPICGSLGNSVDGDFYTILG